MAVLRAYAPMDESGSESYAATVGEELLTGEGEKRSKATKGRGTGQGKLKKNSKTWGRSYFFGDAAVSKGDDFPENCDVTDLVRVNVAKLRDTGALSGLFW